MRLEKYVQLVLVLYEFTSDAGTIIEPAVDVIPARENAAEPPKEHTEDPIKYIEVRLEQRENA